MTPIMSPVDDDPSVSLLLSIDDCGESFSRLIELGPCSESNESFEFGFPFDCGEFSPFPVFD